MPGGGTFDDPTQIETGQVLQLPSDARGDGVQTGPLPEQGGTVPATSEPPVSTELPPSPPQPPSATDKPATVPPASPQTAPPAQTAPSPPAAGEPLPVGLIAAGGGAILALGLSGFLLIRSRRRHREVDYFEPQAPSKRFTPPALPPPEEGPEDPQWTEEPIPPQAVPVSAAGPVAGGPGALLLESRPHAAVEQLESSQDEGGEPGYEVIFDGAPLEVRLGGAGPGHVAWTPLPQIVPSGGAFVRLGDAAQGCLFTDLAAVPGILALDGRPTSVADLADSIVRQAAALEEDDRPRILLAGESVPRLSPAMGVHRFGTLEECCRARAAGLAAATGPVRFELIVADAGELIRPGALEMVRADGPAVVLAIGDVPDAAWRIRTGE